MKKQNNTKKETTKSNNKVFVPGLFVRKSNYGFSLNIEYSEFVKFFNEKGRVSEKNSKTYLRIDINESKSGKPYASLNEWMPEQNK